MGLKLLEVLHMDQRLGEILLVFKCTILISTKQQTGACLTATAEEGLISNNLWSITH